MRLFRKISSVQRLAFAVSCLFVSLAMAGAFLGLLPDERALKIENRARLSEALAIQLASFAMQGDNQAVSAAADAIVARDANILSIGVRTVDGSLVASSDSHAQHWQQSDTQSSSPTHVNVPLSSENARWGTVEIAFTDLDTILLATGLSRQFLYFIAFLTVSGLAMSYVVLRRSLKQLDPKRAVPERVQNAFDSLSDGITIVDQDENVLLLNGSLGSLLGVRPEEQIGKPLSSIGWTRQLLSAPLENAPWQPALKDQTNVRDVAFPVQTRTGMRNLLVNATCLKDDGGRLTGAIVAFKDVTVLEQKNQELAVAIDRLSQSETEIREQNRQLRYLASYDPLTGCMNRRSFFQSLSSAFESARQHFRPIVCVMIDIDHFKSINDQYGHGAGDDVIAGLGQLLRQACRSEDFVGRYGGEEFCMILDDISAQTALSIAERIRAEVASQSAQWLANSRPVTVSIGLAELQPSETDPAQLVERADQALYQAKREGRDRAIVSGAGLQTRLAV